MGKGKAWKPKKPPPPHAFTRMVLHWGRCAHCGLIRLKNDASDAAAQKPCPSYED